MPMIENAPVTIPNSVANCLGNAQYGAVRMNNVINLFAVGANPTPGCQNFFEKVALTPPEFAFLSIPPTGVAGAGTGLTPFLVATTVGAPNDLRFVTIHDGKGPHQVPVYDTPNVKITGNDIPTPFFT